MVAMEGNPSFIQFVAWKIGKALDTKANKVKREYSILQIIVKLMLHIVGFSCLTFAGFTWSITAGLVVAGISCFVLSVLMAPDSDRPNETQPMR
jgi:hypothetical protein